MAGEISASLLSQSGLTPDPETSRSHGGRSAPSLRAASLQTASLSVEHTVETLDRVELTGAFRSGSQTDENGLVVHSDGTYGLSVLSARRETLRIDAEFTSAGLVQVDGGAGEGGLRDVLEDVRDGFRSILRELRDSLVQDPDAPGGTRLTLPGLSSGGLLNGGVFNGNGHGLGNDRKLAGYLEMLRTFSERFGNNPALDRAIESLEAYLNGDGAPQGESASVAAFESYQISIEIEYTEVTQLNVRFGGEQAVQQADPIVIDLDGDGIEVGNVADGVRFDITGDGVAEQVAFPTGGDGFLVFDRNGNGIIDSGRELFGDQHGAANGFEELAKFDSNVDGVIDAGDPIFNQLQVFVDENLNGRSEGSELLSLNQAGIRSILLNYNKASGQINGNRITETGSVLTTDGRQRTAADVLLNYLG